MSEQQGSEQSQEKTEEATPHRRRKAREEGQVLRSKELYASMLFLVMGAAVLIHGPRWGAGFSGFVAATFGQMRPPVDVEREGILAIRSMILFAGETVGPMLVGFVVIVVVIGLAQGQFAFSTKALEPKLSKISPIKGLKKLFGLQAAANLAKQILRILVIGTVGFLVLRGAFGEIVGTLGTEPAFIAQTLGTLAVRLAVYAGFVYFIVALVDYGFEVAKNERELRMTKQEVREEQKTTEGNPWVRARIRAAALMVSRRRQLSAIRSADVVIANPHHRAVGVLLDPDIFPAPIIVAMGEREFALLLRRVAEEAGVPVIENRPLAKLLVETGRVGEPIPEETFLAVHKVLSFIYARYGMKESVQKFMDSIYADRDD